MEETPQATPTEQTPPPGSKGEKLYNNLVNLGFTDKQLGKKDEFIKALSNKISANKIYSGLRSSGLGEEQLGSLVEFHNTDWSDGGEKKNPTDKGSSTGSKPSQDPELQQQLSAYWNHLSPKEQQSLQSATVDRINHPDRIRAATKEEVEGQKAMDTTLGKIKKSLAYIGSETTKGGVQVLKGGAWVLNHMNTSLADTQLIPDKAFKTIDKATDLGVTPGQRAQIEGGKSLGMGAVRTLGMIGNIAPAALGGEAAGIPKTMFALQGMGQGAETMDTVDPDHKLNPAIRDLYIAGSGAVNGLIMGDLGENMLSKPIQDKIVSGIVSHSLQDAVEKGLTEDAIKESTKAATKEFTDAFTKYADKTSRTALDLSALNAAQYALKKGVDVASPEPVFNENLGNLMSNISDVVTKQAPLFGGIGAMLEGKAKDPVEVQKRDLGGEIEALDKQIEAKSAEQPQDVVGKAEQKVEVDRLTKQKDELTNNLETLISEQHDGEKTNVAPDQEKEGRPGQQVAERPQVGQESEKEGGQRLNEEPASRDGKEVVTTGAENAPLKTEENATETGKIEKGDLGEHIGVSQGENVPKDEEKIRQEESRQAGDSGSLQPSEESKITGIKKAVTESLRTQKDLPKVKLSPSLKDFEVLKKGKDLVESGRADPEKIADRIILEGGNYHHENEAPVMLYYAHQLDRANSELQSKISDAEESGNEEAKTLLTSDKQILDDKISKMTEANRINSNSWGKLGNIMQIETDQAFNPVNVRSIIKDNYGGKIPKEVEARLKTIEAERDQAIRDLKKATENQIKKDGEKTVQKIRSSIKLVKQTKAELEAEANDLVTELKKALKRDFGRLNAGIPIPTETLAVLGKLAVNYFKQGVKDFEGLANKIYDDLKDTGIEKSQVREYLSTYEPLREESRERRLTLLGRKERMLNKQLKTGKIRDYSRKPEIVFKKDNEVIKAEQRIADAEYKLKQEKSKSYRQTDNKYQRGLNWIIRWERRSVLASPLILEKLASAATIGSAFNRIPKQLIGGAFSAIFNKVAEKAPIEGGMNIDAEIKFWKEFSNPQKFVNSAWEILKTGASPLTKKYSSRTYEHFAGYDALMDLHAIIKDPPKRATFETSLKYAYEWAAKNDLDYTDPLIKKSLENAAFKRAEYEIFQEDNGVAKRVNDFLNSERKRNNEQATYKALLRFLVPISTVPLNIVRRVGSNIFGLPRGLYEITKAYRNGIDNLTPEQADFIMRQLKNGSTGLAYYTFGLFASKAVLGGLWNKDDKKGNKPHFNQAAFNEMNIGQYSVDKRIQHALPLQLTQLGATTERVYNYYMDTPSEDPKYQAMLKSIAQAMAATTGTQIEEIPMINEPKQAIESFSDPYERKKFAEDLKRRVGFSILDDLGITKKDTETPLEKKLSTITNEDGDKVKLSTSQLSQRKKAYDNAIKENKSDWTTEFNDDWDSDKNTKERSRLTKYWKQIGRSDSYIKEKIADMKQDALDKYIEKQAVQETEEIDFAPPQKNKFTIK